jgi:hypothetical protein
MGSFRGEKNLRPNLSRRLWTPCSWIFSTSIAARKVDLIATFEEQGTPSLSLR